MNLKDVAIIIGHDKYSKGIYSPFLKTREYLYNKGVAKLVGCDIYMHTPHIHYQSKMKATYRKLSHYDLTLELHFNGVKSSSIQGVEALHFHTNTQGKEYARKFTAMVSKEYDIRNRGAKPLSNINQRGYWAVASGIPTGLILEPFFGSNQQALKFKNKERYAKLITRFIQSL